VASEGYPRVWLKAFWGFTPADEGYLGFTRSGDRDSFIQRAIGGDLVLIYGANAPETDTDERRQALGFLEVDPVPIVDRVRLSVTGLKVKVNNGWAHRWTFAVPVRRAWRVNRRIEIRHLAPETYIASRARVIASRGELLTINETINCLNLPVTPVSVFGELPVEAMHSTNEFTLSSLFSPSRGINPTFGPRTAEFEDGAHYLYMLKLEGDTAALLGRSTALLGNNIIVKVGFSKDPKQRRDDHNATLPPAGRLRWVLRFTSKAFPGGQLGKEAEDAMKEQFSHSFESLGGEFFLGIQSELESAFVTASAPAAFHIVATARR
jgi:hypothetical protein